jgi:competence protein ComEC
MLIVPLISLIVYPLSLLTFLFSFLEPVLTFTTFSLEKINTILNMLKVSLVIPKVNILFYLIYYVLLILFIKSNNIKYLLCGLCLIFSFKIKPLLYNETSIYFLDVKQGDSSLIINKNKLILIDTGGVNNYNVSDNTIKFIKSLGYNHLDLLLITHGDSDHMKDGINVVNNIRVDKVIFNNGDYNELEEELINVLEDKKINYYQGLKEIDISNIKFNFLNTGSYDNENDNSNVIYFEIYKYKFLFMGDASVNRENDVLTNYNLSNIDFLKVGHHGSNTSSSKDFINSISPKYSVISVGKNNRYGHPKAEVLDNLANTKIYRTDEDGSVAIKINKNGYKILTYTP